jgi:P4 family phage/plasmid primase-like protien
MNSESIATEITQLIGPAVLLPIPRGSKAPKIDGWPKLTLADMTPNYLQGILKDGNVGVNLGAASNGLCSIDCDGDEQLNEFLKLNDNLNDSLITEGERGGNVWVRIVGDYPRSAKLKTRNKVPWGEFRADGNQTIIWGVHPSGERYRWNELKPVVIPFSSIQWPEELYLPWDPPSPPKQATQQLKDTHSTDVFSRARAYVLQMPEAIQGQGGSDATFAVAKALKHDFDLSDAEAFQIIEEYNNRCVPPWSHKDLLHKLNDASHCTRAVRAKGVLRDTAPSRNGATKTTSGRADSAWDAIMAEVQRSYGAPYIVGKGNEAAALNPDFAPAVYDRMHHVIHDRARRAFYLYDGKSGLWIETTPDTMKRNLGDLIFEIGSRLGCENIAAKERTDGKLTAALNTLRGMTDGRFDDRPKGIIHCLNGMLEVATGILHPFEPRYKSRNQTPFNWENRARCPRFLSELLQPALNEDDIKAIQMYAGLALMGRNLSQMVALLTGTPGGGKSQLCIILEGLIGGANCTQLRTDNLTERFELARLVGKTLLTGKDVPGNFLMTKGAHVIKSLSGGDALTTEIKGTMGSDTIDGEFAIVITSNSRLRVRLDGDTGAWRRRLIIVNYERPKPEKAIPDFARILLQEEGPGILCWAVEGAKQLLSLNHKFPVTKEQQARVDSLLDESNALRTFVSTQIERSEGNTLTTSEITEAFFAFCKKRTWNPLTHHEVEKELPDAMLEIHGVGKSNNIQRYDKNARGYRGVKIVGLPEDGTDGTDDSDPHVNEELNY